MWWSMMVMKSDQYTQIIRLRKMSHLVWLVECNKSKNQFIKQHFHYLADFQRATELGVSKEWHGESFEKVTNLTRICFLSPRKGSYRHSTMFLRQSVSNKTNFWLYELQYLTFFDSLQLFGTIGWFCNSFEIFLHIFCNFLQTS